MTMTATILYKQTCEFCDKVSKLVLTFFIGMYEMGESFGRARAAALLHRQGHTELAKQLILNEDKRGD